MTLWLEVFQRACRGCNSIYDWQGPTLYLHIFTSFELFKIHPKATNRLPNFKVKTPAVFRSTKKNIVKKNNFRTDKKLKKITPTRAFFIVFPRFRNFVPQAKVFSASKIRPLRGCTSHRRLPATTSLPGRKRWKGRPYCLMVKLLAFQMGYIYGIY